MKKKSLNQIKFDEALGKHLKSFRSGTIDDLNHDAELNITRSALAALEHGRHSMTAFQLYKISKALYLSVDEIFKLLDKNISNEKFPTLSWRDPKTKKRISLKDLNI